MNKELPIRRKIKSIYNKREEDFESLREYNDYLEEVEDIIFNLVSGIDVKAIEAKVERYKEENADQIAASSAKRVEELAAALRQEQGHADIKPVHEQEIDSTGQLGDNLYAPNLGAYTQSMLPAVAAQPMPISGTAFNESHEDEQALKIRQERAASAGGWTRDFVWRRALQEAMSSLWVD